MAKEFIYDAFVVEGEENSGNAAHIYLDADDLTAEDKASLAKKSSLKDVVFVSKPTLARAHYKLEYYMDGEQTLISGHPTIAAFACMYENSSMSEGAYSVELVNGRIVYVAYKDGKVFLEQEHPVYEEPSMEDIMSILDATGLTLADLIPNHMPMLVLASNKSMVVGVKSMDKLKAIQPSFEKLKNISEELEVVGFIFYTAETVHEDSDFSTRVFAPAVGVNEDSASGTLAGALGCYIYDLQEAEQDTFSIEQGYFMEQPRPSFVKVYMETEERKFLGPRVGGMARQAK
ncbi:MAG: PhzF family phenazine biosynthesis isomerase [Pseudomonadota bacterium]|nr:PhzF family phenazine biosynthesis isomerase [Pseudomonadota bacterium]